MEDNRSIREILDTYQNSEAFKEQKKLIEASRKNMKSGPNVVGLVFLGELDDSDLSELEQELNRVELELGWSNKSGISFNSLEDYSLVTFLILSQPIVAELIQGLATNAIWDGIKATILIFKSKMNGKLYNRVTSKGAEEKEIRFGVNVQLDENTSFNFKLEGDLDNTIIEKSLDKMLDFLREQKPNNDYQIPNFVYLDEGEWKSVNVMNELGKKTSKIKNRKKKK